MARAGFPLNGIYDDDAEEPNRHTSVLYEGVVADFLARYPGIDPVWDEEWRGQTDGCVDLWIKWSEVDNTIDVNLEHWTVRALAERYGDDSSVEAMEAALSGSDDMHSRVETIAGILEKSLVAASKP